MIKALALLLLIAGPLSEKPLRPLRAYGQCDVSPFKVEQVDYLSQPVERSIHTSEGDRSVVMEEGARILVSYKDRPFLNLKAERFARESFLKDKKTQIDGLRKVADGTPEMDTSGLKATSIAKLEVYQIQRKQMEGNVLSVLLAIDEPNRVIMTGYFLNDYPEARGFKTLDEFRLLRDSYIKTLSTCLSK